MEIVATASLITAFLAGFAALLAPCCIGILLPSYLASVFKTKTKIILMTFVYYLGLLTVFLPLGLGMAGLGSYLSRYHGAFFVVGGLFMVALGLFLVFGKSVMLPMKLKPQLKKYDLGSIYLLGVFSGVATSCCAPVLAGVLALSVLPGSWALGTLYSAVFVTGMIVPLFIMAMFADRTQAMERIKLLRRKINYTLLGRKITVNLSHLVSGLLFITFGLLVLVFQRSGSDTPGSSYQEDINLLTARFNRWIGHITNAVPEAVWAVVFIAIIIAIGWSAYRQAASESNNNKGD